MNVTIKLTVETGHARSPHADVLAACTLLTAVIAGSSETEPALGGELLDSSGRRVGSYIVEFG